MWKLQAALTIQYETAREVESDVMNYKIGKWWDEVEKVARNMLKQYEVEVNTRDEMI